MTVTITSKLWKFMQLTRNGTYFPALVEGAALAQGKAYTPALLAHVASRAEVLDAVNLTIVDGRSTPIDEVIEQLITTAGEGVDQVIMAAVASYTPPATEQGS